MTAPGVVSRPDPTFVTNERGGPVPPQDVLQRLHRIDVSLGLRFMANLDQSHWAITWEWPDSDWRWARVRSQEIPRDAAYDIVGYLPVDCAVTEACGYVERSLKAYPKEEISKLRARINHWNDVEMPAQQTQALITDTLDDVARSKRQQNPRRKRVEVSK